MTSDQSTTAPLVSIGVFLYNEGRFLRETLHSLLAQDYPNIEFIVSDNCSTDDTAIICEEILGGETRATYERLDENIGAAANSIRVLDRAHGEYFMWASGHDLWSSNYVSACVAKLEAHPLAALAYGPSDWIDKAGASHSRESGMYDTRGLDPLIRLFFAFWGNLHPVLGVIRTQLLKSLPKIHACSGSDQIVLAELALAGDFIWAPETSWVRRCPRDPETHKQRIQRYTSAEFGLARSWFNRRLPLLRLPFEISRAVLRSKLGFSRKIAALLALLPAFLVRYMAAKDAG